MKRFRIVVETGYAGAGHEEEVEFEDEYWDRLTEAGRSRALEDCVQDAISNHIDGWWESLD